MNPLISTKAMVVMNFNVLRHTCYRTTWHNDYYRLSSLATICTDVREFKVIPRLVNPFPLGVSNDVSYARVRSFYTTPTWKGQESSSKVEETVKSLKEQKEQKEKMTAAPTTDVVKPPEKAVAEKRLSALWQKIKAEMLHYYHGFRLLGLDMKISAKLIWRILKGKELSRREHRLLIKTTGDMFRLIPFSVFIIVPFMEFLLPVAIKLFPGMLPSTFQTATEKEDKLKQALKVKIEMAKFLQKTLDDMAVQSSSHVSENAKEFTEFFYKLRKTGAVATTDEIMKFSKLFEDEITLDSLTRPQLVALCRVLDVRTLGTSNFLRFLLRMKLRSLVADDKLIEKEGVESLTRAELQQACKARGMRAYGLPDHKLKEQLSQWLDLSLNKKVSASLLLLTRALMVSDTIPMTDKLKATISALPDAVVARTTGAIGEKEGKLDHRTNIEIIKLEEKKIEEERREKKEAPPEPVVFTRSDKIDEITTTDVKALEQALDTIGKDKKMAVEKEEIKELKEEMAEYQEDIQELYKMKAEAKGEADIESIKVSKGAKRLFNKVNKMISKMDAVLTELEQSEKKMKKEIEALPPDVKLDSKAAAELVRIDELIAAIKKIQNVPDEFRLAHIAEILGKIDDDRDGAIKIEDILKVVELIGKEDVKLSKKQVNELIELMDKEEVLEVEEQIQKALKKEEEEGKGQEEQIKVTPSPVPATPVTKEPRNKDEELKDEIAEPKKSFKNTSASIDGERDSSAAVLKPSSSSESVRNPPIVPPSPKKTEGSKQL
ncbi:mitochondrial proton/calcium exchanger protein [Orussus abietinus]|uniref:mitochondrial proton/calcium exchanger protein n=1 Tax=Orussus abietinus TaxID=222816 RepID=UPI0006250915|nr:mitochondrial proton/calcium exchanger protein [Orussus abietinus]